VSDASPERLSLDQARTIALAAQGFEDRPPTGQPDRRILRRVIARTGLLQVDSVNVLIRAHYLPAYSRVGAYDPALLDRLAYGRRRELFEYWGHEASLIPVQWQPLFRWRMARARDEAWGGMRAVATEQPQLLAAVRSAVAEHGAMTAAEIEQHQPASARRDGRAGPWWDWSHVKRAVEFLFWSGELTTASRRGFERVYDLTERVLPADVVAAPTPSEADAIRQLVDHAAVRSGVATAADLRDYFRLPVAETAAAMNDLIDAGRLMPVSVDGVKARAYLHVEARRPRPSAITPSALLSPFDPLVWNRARTERLFGMRYRIEIYVPSAKRVHGYYVLPFLHRGRLVARVDLKADRQRSQLLVPSSHREPAATEDDVVALAAHLRAMADWLGLDGVVVGERGDAARALSGAVSRT
jgi:uncharacterized protein YcaQ